MQSLTPLLAQSEIPAHRELLTRGLEAARQAPNASGAVRQAEAALSAIDQISRPGGTNNSDTHWRIDTAISKLGMCGFIDPSSVPREFGEHLGRIMGLRPDAW
jgi:hypothetical protein